jgi:hypothetical protein
MQRHLDDYIRVETDIMLILAQMSLQTARKQQDNFKGQQELDIPPETLPLVAGEGFNITNSGVFSYAERDSHIEALNTTAPGQAEIITSTPIPSGSRSGRGSSARTFSWSGRRVRQHCRIKLGRTNETYVRRSGPITCQATTDKGGVGSFFATGTIRAIRHSTTARIGP